MKEDLDFNLHCFRCGLMDVEEDELGPNKLKCPECGEYSLMTLAAIMDKLNEMYLSGGFSITKRARF